MWEKIVQFSCYGCGADPGDESRAFHIGEGIDCPTSVGETQ